MTLAHRYCLCLILCGIVLFCVTSCQQKEEAASGAKVGALSFTGVSENDFQAIRAEPTKIAELYRRDAVSFAGALPHEFARLNEDERKLLYCMMIANRMSPYGESDAKTLDRILQSTKLNCANYSILMLELAGRLRLDESRYEIASVGWDGGVVGNHQVVFVRRKSGSFEIMVDPTIGLAAIASFDDVASGKPIAASRIVATGTRGDIQKFRETMTQALVEGGFRPSDLLYYFTDWREARHFNPSGQWATPALNDLRSHLDIPDAPAPASQPR